MKEAARAESLASPPIRAHIGPIIPAQATALRYAAAVAVVLATFALRASLAPLLGIQAPLLPFLLAVLLAAYLGGRGPALLASFITPPLATVWLTGWPHDAPPFQWIAHVTFFLLVAILSALIMHALQEALRRASDWAARAEAAAQALREEDRRKDEFLAMLAHELRNPLAPIRNAAHLLGRNPDDAAMVRRAAEMLERQSNHLAHLVDDLLDVARITHRRIVLERDIVSLDHVVATALEAVQPAIEARRQIVTTQVARPRVLVEGDEVRLCQVLANLLTNASKYSANGQRIHIEVGGDAHVATLVVRDEGQGIDPQIMPRLFDLFMQGDRTLDRAQGGLGIGLTIVKHLVEMHGGTVAASSAGHGRGSEFRITLPRASERSEKLRAEPPPSRERRRVLVVDDNVDNGDSLRELLRLEGHDVRVVRDGAAALESLDRFAADVILLDVGLPRMDGYMVAHAIRARFGSQPRPHLVALTGYASSADREAALRSGFDDHLAKPVEPQRLLRMIADAAAKAPETLS